jgi:Secretion system C-terminal sorting domain
LKYLLTILLFIIGLNFTSFAQTKPASSGDPAAKLIKFYPNPSTTVVNFELQRGYDKSYTLQVSNFMGKRVFEQTKFTQKTTINLSNFYRGLYFYQLVDRSGRIVETGRFQVVK